MNKCDLDVHHSAKKVNRKNETLIVGKEKRFDQIGLSNRLKSFFYASNYSNSGSNRASSFKSAEREAPRRFEITSTINPKL